MARIRRIVTAATVAVFLALFATIYIQMAAGKDPALGDVRDDRPGYVDDEFGRLRFRQLVVFGLGHDHRAVVSSGA